MGSLEPLRGYQGEDIEIQLPGNLTVYDIDWLAVWCVEYRHNFGHVYIPKDLDVPPALGQTKITVIYFTSITRMICSPLTRLESIQMTTTNQITQFNLSGILACYHSIAAMVV